MKFPFAALVAALVLAGPPLVSQAQDFRQSLQSANAFDQMVRASRTSDANVAATANEHAGSAISSELAQACPAAGCTTCKSADCGHCCSSRCCSGTCLHRSGVFADYLYWQVRDVDMPYAVPQDGIGGVGTVPVGEVGVLDFDYSSGFRTGFDLAIDCCSSVSATFTWYETNTNDFTSADAPDVVQPLVLFPGTFNAGFTAQAASAAYSLDLQMADLDYSAVWTQGSRYHINYLAGVRYGHLDQSFRSVFPFAPPDGTTTVDSDINFDGGGIRLGLEGERLMLPARGIRVYAKGVASVLAGDFRSSYLQVNQFNGIEAATSIRDSRVVPILEYELGLSWQNCRDTVRVSAGYYFSCWSNVVTTPEYIDAVQNTNYVDVGDDGEDDISFEGLVARLELRL